MYLSSMCIPKSNKLHNPANLKILIQTKKHLTFQTKYIIIYRVLISHDAVVRF